MKHTGCIVIVILIVIAAFAYNQYKIDQLQNQVATIAGKFNIKTDGKIKGGEMVTALARAEYNTRRAKELLRQGKTKQAQQAIDAALVNLKSANTVSTDIVKQASGYFGKAKEEATQMFQKAWKDISKEAKEKR